MIDDHGLSRIVEGSGQVKKLEGEFQNEIQHLNKLYEVAEHELKNLFSFVEGPIGSMTIAAERGMADRVAQKKQELDVIIDKVVAKIADFKAWQEKVAAEVDPNLLSDPNVQESKQLFDEVMVRIATDALSWKDRVDAVQVAQPPQPTPPSV